METSFSSVPSIPEPEPSSPKSLDTQMMLEQASLNKQKKPRHRHTPYQLQKLNELYEKNDHPALQERLALGEHLGMQTKTLNAWFQNKRASAKKRSNKTAELPNSTTRVIPSLSTSTTSSTTDSPSYPYPVLEDLEEDFTPEYSSTTIQETYSATAGDKLNLNELAIDPNMSHKKRLRPNTTQSQQLKEYFNVTPHPSKEERQELGDLIGMSYQSVTNWFQNQRSLIKRRKEEEQQATPPRSRTFAPFPPASGHPSLPTLTSFQEPSSVRDEYPSSIGRSRFNKPRRARPEPYQLDALRSLYNRTSNPTIEERTALAAEVGLEVGKVTNWFRNLRQTSRKRAKVLSDFGEDEQDEGSIDFGYPPSSSVSRDASPLHFAENDSMDIDAPERTNSREPSDDEDHWEAVTPSSSPPPAKPVINVDPILYAEWEKETAKYTTGVRIEDALLLIGFHHDALVLSPCN